MSRFDLSYVTVDSVNEGVGSSQILPLIMKLSKMGLKIHLTSFEKNSPSEEVKSKLDQVGATWNYLKFEKNGVIGGIQRANSIRKEIPETKLIHARSDVPAAGAIASNKAPVLWDVRSLWADQRLSVEKSLLKKQVLKSARILEAYSCLNADGMSTLTHNVVPELEKRYSRTPEYKVVVPTTVDLNKFRFSNKLPRTVKVLYSGTYNQYYDLALSRRFTDKLNAIYPIEIFWARPKESEREKLDVGENSVFQLSPSQISNILQEYSFGMSVCKLEVGPSLKAAMPTKVAEFLAAGRPIVINKGLGDLDEFVSEFDAGVVLDGSESNLDQSAIKMIELLNDFETPYKCRALAEKYFNFEDGINKYLKIYSQISIT